ncbi:BnaC05g16090D [Brassica napus]|uniref:BnaC05g16090D protein n=1 Tax=Brassica napus TaxID=3708 RepID=A0A078GYD9_BRANA|nr:BnaC05g16090D [Brassica napus]
MGEDEDDDDDYDYNYWHEYCRNDCVTDEDDDDDFEASPPKRRGGGHSGTNRNRRSGPTMLRAGINQRKRLASGNVLR